MGSKSLVKLIICFCFALPTWAQQDGYKLLPLDDMSQFKTQAGNWRIVGDVVMDRRVDVHPPAPEETDTKKKKKKKKKRNSRDSVEEPKAVHATAGTGILLNENTAEIRDALLTSWEHGDIDLSLEVMLPKGSNSGIYLQGRYEVQLYDSWGIRSPKFSDIGGIYRNWQSEPGKIYMGKAPLSNPSKAPGLWQKLEIAFRAPKFDPSGKKVSNALLAYVDLNGIRIHENVEIPLPTGGPISQEEAASGPLMIQGDHGPVAFRNIRYRTLQESRVKLGDLNYQVYHQPIINVDELADAKPVYEGSQAKLSCTVAKVPDQFAIQYQGTLDIPEDDTYEFTLTYTGGAILTIDGNKIINQQRPDGWWRNDGAKIDLKKGVYPITLSYYKNAEWMPPRLGLKVKASSTYSQDLHDFGSYPPDQNPVSSIPVNSEARVKLLRAFLDFKGDNQKRLTHTIAVGEPSGINYVYNLAQGSLTAVWRGDFIDATPMWHSRGDGSFKPRGATIYLQSTNALHTSLEAAAKPMGYKLDPQTGRPIFHYELGGLKVSDQIIPINDGRELQHNVSFEGSDDQAYYLLATSDKIRQMPDGSYAIDDQSYYITVHQGAISLVDTDNGQQLRSNPVGSLSYTITW